MQESADSPVVGYFYKACDAYPDKCIEQNCQSEIDLVCDTCFQAFRLMSKHSLCLYNPTFEVKCPYKDCEGFVPSPSIARVLFGLNGGEDTSEELDNKYPFEMPPAETVESIEADDDGSSSVSNDGMCE